MPKLVIHFPRFGPYHLARIESAHQAFLPYGVEVIGLEIAGSDDTYAWTRAEMDSHWPRFTLFREQSYDSLGRKELVNQTWRWLDSVDPQAIAICGYSSLDAMTLLRWCSQNRRTAILMTESRRADARRTFWKEWIKGRRVRKYDYAICGGQEHKDYLVQLGLPVDKIHFGYDVVDNNAFRRRQDDELQVAASIVLASGRFVRRKNYGTLLQAFSHWRNSWRGTDPWHLVLLGDGEERTNLIQLCRNLHVPVKETAPWQSPSHEPSLYLPGFVQIEDLWKYYSISTVFAHPAESEPWGLVINEAMASGLPIMSSRNCGAALELIESGYNGWIVEPNDCDQWMKALVEVTGMSSSVLRDLGQNAQQTIESRCPVSAFGQSLLNILTSK